MALAVQDSASPDRRPLLRTIVVLGIVVTFVSGAGVFAVFTDQATTGSNSVVSGALASAADLQLATATPIIVGGAETTQVTCGTFVDDLATGLISVTNAAPSVTYLQRSYFCLKNAGTAAIGVRWAATDLADVETDCTGDEATVDTGCGVVAGTAYDGELSQALRVRLSNWDCGTGASNGDILAGFENLTQPGGVPIQGELTLGPGDVYCGSVEVLYLQDTAVDIVQAAQSDQATWRFAFNATTF
jgi:hypothetical protein